MGFVNTEKVKARFTQPSSWVLPKEESCIAPDDVYSNKGESCDRSSQKNSFG